MDHVFPDPKEISYPSQTTVRSREGSSWFANSSESRAQRPKLNLELHFGFWGARGARGGWLQISPHTHPSGNLR